MAASLLILLGTVLISGAAGLLYLASHQQQILRHRASLRPCVLSASVVAVFACLALCTATSLLVGLFMACVVLMLVLSLSPVLIALVVQKRRS
ncbi:hypothetical protein [Asaia astilbis]|uniref:hypothetical protein n=1 Tax=Asaia astilbis TaxID=610244 RepID=UPI00046F8351|nr:hypothetical protein [Asaia astilbis]